MSKSDTTKSKRRFKAGDIVLVSSPAGNVIPNVHVKLLKRIVVKATPGRLVGFRKTMDWPGYSGWEATLIYQDEIDLLRKKWGIPYTAPGKDITFVYDEHIIKKPRKRQNTNKQSTQKRKNYAKVKNGKKIN